LDHFHIVKALNDAVDEVRKEVCASFHENEPVDFT